MAKSLPLLALIVVLIAGVIFQQYVTSLPELKQPVAIGSARFAQDSGSVSASFVDNDGYEFQFGLHGDGQTDPSTLPLFFIRNPQLVPYVYWPTAGGPTERAVYVLLDNWINANVSPDLKDQLRGEGFEGFEPEELKVAAVYRVYEVLKSRHRHLPEAETEPTETD